MLNLIVRTSAWVLARTRAYAFPKMYNLAFYLGIGIVAGCHSRDNISTSSAANNITFSTCQLQRNNTITIGALLPETGSLKESGLLQLALIDTCKQKLETTLLKDSGLQLDIQAVDTQSSSKEVPSAMKEILANTCLIAGPSGSSEAAAALKIANSQGAILVSPMSTSPTLALNEDNLFRLAPSDKHQGEAIARVMKQNGIDCVIGVARNDVWGNNLYRSVKSALEKNGGKMVRLLNYPTDLTDFRDQLKILQTFVQLATVQCGGGDTGHVAIQLSSYDEGVALLAQANEMEKGASEQVLSSVQWYGSDSLTLLPSMLQTPQAADFAIKTHLQSSIFAISKADEPGFEAFANQVKKNTGYILDNYSANFCDALLLLTQTALDAGKEPTSLSALRTQITATADRISGITGPLRLDAAGDRDSSLYDFYTVIKQNEAYTWKRILEGIEG